MSDRRLVVLSNERVSDFIENAVSMRRIHDVKGKASTEQSDRHGGAHSDLAHR
jgi:hypothetical protein